MKPLLLAVFVFCYSVSIAQTEVKLEDLKAHIGDTVKVQGKISGVAANIENANRNPILIYVGEKYPHQAFTISISTNVISKLHITPSGSDVGNIVWVYGRVEKYSGKLRINITDPRQIDIVQDMQGEPE
jgi:hypothetical protein